MEEQSDATVDTENLTKSRLVQSPYPQVIVDRTKT